MINRSTDSAITSEIIGELLKSKTSELEHLKTVYCRLPDTCCRRKTHCCSMLPEASLLESLAALQRLRRMPARQRHKVHSKIIEYFFINPAQVTACPFLEEKRCIIYEDRFFGCRAYGLWSPQHYEKMARQNRQAKLALAQQWRKLGINLPDKVLDYRVPYCLDVAVAGGARINDGELEQISHQIEALSGQLSPWHNLFRRKYFADLSFLTTAAMYGINSVLQMKVDIVREITSAGSRHLLNQALQKVEDGLMPFG